MKQSVSLWISALCLILCGALLCGCSDKTGTATSGGNADGTDLGVAYEKPVLEQDENLVAFSYDQAADLYTDTATGKTYRRAPMCYEPVTLKTGYGEVDGAVLYRVANAENLEFLSLEYTGMGNELFYCTDITLPEADAFQPKKALICRQDAITVSENEIVDVSLLETLLRTLKSGKQEELPTEAENARRIKFVSDAYPALYYSVRYFEDSTGNAFLRDPASGRLVSVGTLLDGYVS